MFWNSTKTCVIGIAGQSIVYSTSFIPFALIDFSTTAFTSSSLLTSLKPCTTALYSIGTVHGFSFVLSSRQVFSFAPDLFFSTAPILASKSVNFSSIFASAPILASKSVNFSSIFASICFSIPAILASVLCSRVRMSSLILIQSS